MTGNTTLIHGSVVDAQGQPVAGGRISWVKGPVALPDVMLLSDARGGFTLAAPAPGDYTLRCDTDDHGSVEQALKAAGKPLAVRLELPR